MTLRKPPGLEFESWIDRQIREGMDTGAFDHLPGAGKPIPGIGGPHDDAWWVKQKLRHERVSVLAPTLALRKEAEDARRAPAQLGALRRRARRRALAGRSFPTRRRRRGAPRPRRRFATAVAVGTVAVAVLFRPGRSFLEWSWSHGRPGHEEIIECPSTQH